MRDNAGSKGQMEKLLALRRECQMMSRQEGHTHIRDRLKKGSGETWKIVKEFSGGDNKTTQEIKDEGRTLSSLEASDKGVVDGQASRDAACHAGGPGLIPGPGQTSI
jgi:hypothetical protein